MSARLGSPPGLSHFAHGIAHGLPDRGAGSPHQVRAVFVVLTSIALAGVVLGVFPPYGALRVYLVAVVAIVAFAAVTSALSGFGRIERRSRPRSRAVGATARPPFFERAQRRLELASSSNVQFEQLRPRLQEIAEQRLAGHAVRLQSDAARDLLGEQEWSLLVQPRSGDKFAPGPRPAALRALIDALERL